MMKWNKLPNSYPEPHERVLLVVSDYPTPENPYPTRDVSAGFMCKEEVYNKVFYLGVEAEPTELLVHAWMKLPELP